MAGDTATIHLTRGRLLVGLLALVLLCSGASFAAAQAGDPDPDDPYTDTDDPAAVAMAQMGCALDGPVGVFAPDATVSRLDLARVLQRCVGRADFAETSARLRSSSRRLLTRHLDPGASTEVGGGFYNIDVAIEVTTNAVVRTPCTARFDLHDAELSGTDEQVFVDIPANTGRTAQHLNASIVERVRIVPAFRRAAFAQMELNGVLVGGCAVPVTAEIAFSATYAPLNGQGQTWSTQTP